jgi:hypothetical protein
MPSGPERMSFNGRTPALQAGHAGSIPVARSAFFQFIHHFRVFVRLIAA